MSPTTHWLLNGHLLNERPQHCSEGADLVHRCGLVRVVSGPEGTEIRWSATAPSFASLFYVMEWLLDLPSPFMLRFFLCGWFEETVESAVAARQRLQQIVARSDVHLLQRTFVHEFDPSAKRLPRLLSDALARGANACDDHAVDCQMDDRSGRFRVVHIGAKSAIARLWGLAPVSFPCLPGGTYDSIVSDAYREVLRSGRTRYDHIYAAMVTPDSSVVWIPYQRVVMPAPPLAGSRSVRVVSEIAKVDIEII